MHCLKHHVELVTAGIARLWSPYFASRDPPFELAVLTFVTEVASIGLTAVVHELEHELGPVCPWDTIRMLLPAWNRADAALRAVQDKGYPKRGELLAYQNANASQDGIDEDTFLIQYLAEVQLEAVSVYSLHDHRDNNELIVQRNCTQISSG